jgi:hypothetical protein
MPLQRRLAAAAAGDSGAEWWPFIHARAYVPRRRAAAA